MNHFEAHLMVSLREVDSLSTQDGNLVLSENQSINAANDPLKIGL